MIVQRLQGTKGLLILDEAQHLMLPALESLRSIHDATACGLVLMGNEAVYSRLSGRHSAEFAQLYSRVGSVLKLENPLPRTLRHWLGTGGSKKNPRQQSPPPKPRRWQGIRLFPFHGTKRTCSLAGGGAAAHKPLVKTRGGVALAKHCPPKPARGRPSAHGETGRVPRGIDPGKARRHAMAGWGKYSAGKPQRSNTGSP